MSKTNFNLGQREYLNRTLGNLVAYDYRIKMSMIGVLMSLLKFSNEL
jgi:hypothetical protein